MRLENRVALISGRARGIGGRRGSGVIHNDCG